MGVSISFVSATTEELDRAEQDPSWADEFYSELYSGTTTLYPVASTAAPAGTSPASSSCSTRPSCHWSS